MHNVANNQRFQKQYTTLIFLHRNLSNLFSFLSILLINTKVEPLFQHIIYYTLHQTDYFIVHL